MLGNLRRRPWLALLVPGLLASFVRAARRVDADLMHAHWLPAGWVALRTGRPYVVQVWGTDVELVQRAPRLAGGVFRGARLVIAPSNALADTARQLGAREVRMIPSGVDLPTEVGEEAEPAEVLFSGRLSPEKGVLELVEAARGMNLVATDVGGLRDLVVDGETGLVVPPRDPVALRQALMRLLEDSDLRRRLGGAGRVRAQEVLSWHAVTEMTLAAYSEAIGPTVA